MLQLSVVKMAASKKIPHNVVTKCNFFSKESLSTSSKPFSFVARMQTFTPKKLWKEVVVKLMCFFIFIYVGRGRE